MAQDNDFQVVLIVPYDKEWDGEEDLHQVGFSHVYVEKEDGIVNFKTDKEGSHVVSLSDDSKVVGWTFSEGFEKEASQVVYWYLKAQNEKKFRFLMFEERPLNAKKRCR